MNGGTVTRAYDVDDHLISSKNLSTNPIPCVPGVVLDCEGTGNGAVPGNSSATYTWGTNGHPVQYTSGAATNWLHWNPAANNMLFENGPGLQTDLAIDRFGVSNASNGVTVEDRDPFGGIAATHTSLEFGPWASAPTQRLNPKTGITGGGAGSQYPYPGQDAQYSSHLLDAGRPDAYIDGLYGISFQGVRSVDVNTGQWMSLDSFGGYTTTPISEQPYLWENNNWLRYSDPSGYDSTPCYGGAEPASVGRRSRMDSSSGDPCANPGANGPGAITTPSTGDPSSWGSLCGAPFMCYTSGWGGLPTVGGVYVPCNGHCDGGGMNSGAPMMNVPTSNMPSWYNGVHGDACTNTWVGIYCPVGGSLTKVNVTGAGNHPECFKPAFVSVVSPITIGASALGGAGLGIVLGTGAVKGAAAAIGGDMVWLG